MNKDRDIKRGDFIFKILEVIGDTAVGVADLLDVFLSVGYGASYGKLQYELSKKQRERESKLLDREIQKDARQKYYNLIYKLKTSGLIEEKERDNKKFFNLTKKGKEKLFSLKENNKKKLPNASYPQSKEDNAKFVVVIFDIPERERRKRGWLRAALNNLGLKMIQKSVWIGKARIPKEFLKDLFKLKLIDYVEIFEISKTGSLKNLV
jgi:DNA-binding PadR family transcriptional regulator